MSISIHLSTLSFLKQLKSHNNKQWFDAHRKEYDEAKNNFIAFVSEILSRMQKFEKDVVGLNAKDTVFRINRDIRFSADKSPYKKNLAAAFGKGGKNSMSAGYYFHLEPENNSFAGGGVWMPQPVQLAAIRQEIDYNLKDFKKIINSKNFVKHFNGLDQTEEFKLKTTPKGFSADNPAIEYLKFKSFIAGKNFSDKEVTSSGFITEIVESYHVLFPFIQFLNKAVA